MMPVPTKASATDGAMRAAKQIERDQLSVRSCAEIIYRETGVRKWVEMLENISVEAGDLIESRSPQMRACNWILFSAVILALGLSDCLRAQAVGEILGTVQDPSGAVVPKATIIAVQNGTGFTRSTFTGNAGTYSITTLPVGSYSVRAEAPGSKALRRT